MRKIFLRTLQGGKRFNCVDLKKGLDQIRLNDVTNVLKENGVATDLINIIEEVNTNTTTNMQTTKELTKATKCGSGKTG